MIKCLLTELGKADDKIFGHRLTSHADVYRGARVSSLPMHAQGGKKYELP